MRRGNIKTNENINEKKQKKSNIDKRKLLSLIITCLLAVTSVASAVIIGVVGILPFKYMIALILGLLLLNTVLVIVLLKNRKGKKVRLVVNIIQGMFIVLQTIAVIYVLKTFSFMNKMTEGVDTKKENYSVIVLKDSKYEKIKDLKVKVVEYYSNELDNSELAIDELKKQVEVSAVSNEDVYVVGKTLLNTEVDAIVIEESQKLMLDEELEGFLDKTKVIGTLSVDISVETIAKDAAVASEPFIVYISGIDTYGTIASVSRSDVNMVAVINPKTYQVLLVNIPRDYYVQLHGTSGKRDKLTHAGMYGVQKSVQTIEDLLKIDINYYFKVNFTSLESIVDAVGGIEVNSDYSFTEYMGVHSYVKGMNKLNGAQALAFARERKAFRDGDRQRGRNQQAVLSALVEQVSKPSIITKFDTLLKSLSDKFQTNMQTDKMMELVKLQISKMPTWNISTVSLTGSDARAYAYSSGSTPLYVMLPSQNSINDAISKIQTIISGGVLEGAYDSVTGSVISLRSFEIPVVAEEPEEIIEQPEDKVVDEDTKVDDTSDNDNVKDDTELDNNKTESDKDTEGNTGTVTPPEDSSDNTQTPDSGSDSNGGTTTPDNSSSNNPSGENNNQNTGTDSGAGETTTNTEN